MDTKFITYGGRGYELTVRQNWIVIPDEKIRELPRGLLLLVYLLSAIYDVWLDRETFLRVYNAVQVWVDPRMGGLSEVGVAEWGGDLEVVAVAQKHREHLQSERTRAQTVQLMQCSDPDVQSAAMGASSIKQEAPEEEIATTDALSPVANLVTPDVGPETPRPKPDLATLLGCIRDFLLRFVVFSKPEQAVAVALWIVHTWVLDAFDVTPYLHISSATKRCGKSRLLECLSALVCRPWPVVSATDATLLRKIEADAPTILFDEVDTIYRSGRDKSKEGLRAVLNAGFVRGAKVPRCVGREVVEHDVFCPKVLAGIGDGMPDTVKDRCIRIQLCRRAKDQPIERFRRREVEPWTNAVVEDLAAWSSAPETIEALRAARPDIPPDLGDRAADIIEPLLAIADLAGGEWAADGRAVLVSLLRGNEEENDDLGIRLLGAIRDVFTGEGRKQLATCRILQRLAAREEESPWTTQWPRAMAGGNMRGPAAKMADLLKPFGISGGTIRLPDGSTPKGYRLEAFSDAFARYLPDSPPQHATTPQASPHQGLRVNDTENNQTS